MSFGPRRPQKTGRASGGAGAQATRAPGRARRSPARRGLRAPEAGSDGPGWAGGRWVVSGGWSGDGPGLRHPIYRGGEVCLTGGGGSGLKWGDTPGY